MKFKRLKEFMISSNEIHAIVAIRDVKVIYPDLLEGSVVFILNGLEREVRWCFTEPEKSSTQDSESKMLEAYKKIKVDLERIVASRPKDQMPIKQEGRSQNDIEPISI